MRETLRSARDAASPQELLDSITGILARGLDADLSGAFEYLPDSGTAILQAGVGWDRGAMSVIRVEATPGSAARRVLDSPAAIVFSQSGEPDPLGPPTMLAGHSCASASAVRVQGPDHPFGYIAVCTLAAREFGAAETEIIEAAAEATSLALGRLRAERRFAAQWGVAEIAASAEELSEASSKILELIGSGVGWDVATLWLVEEEADQIRCVDAWEAPGISEEFIEASLGRTHGRGEGIPGSVWESGKPRWFTDLPRESALLRADAARRAGLMSALLFPIIAQGRVVGIFEVFTRNVEQPDEPLLADLAAFGTQIGHLLERELVRAEVRRSSEELRLVLNNLATAVSAINPDGSLRFANDAAARSVGLANVEELLAADLAGMRNRFRVFDEHGAELKGPQSDPLRRALAGEPVGPALVRLLDSETGDERWFQLRTAPITDAAGNVAWALAAVDDVTQLKRNEERLRRSETAHRRIGEVLQRGLLPPAMPEIPSVALAVRFRALGDQTLIGGDFYDAFPIPGDRWMIVVGDITGKGVEAAAFTALVRYTIRAVAVRDRDPAAALAQLNEMLIEDPAQPRLCTAVCALIDPDRPNLVTVARGGHPPPLLLAEGDRRPTRIEPAGPILGAFADAAFDTERFALSPKDAFVLYTDGVSDAGVRTERGALEIEGIEAQLTDARDQDAEGLASAIDAAAASADSGGQHDDALVVVLRGR